MTAPAVSNTFNQDISTQGFGVNVNFLDLVNYLAQRNNGTASWDALSVSGTVTFAGNLSVTGTLDITGASTFHTAITITPTTDQIILGTTRTVTLSAPTPATTSRIHTIPDISAAGTFAFLEGTQTFSGAKTFSTAVTINPTTNQIVLGVTNTTTLSATAPAASRVYTIPDISGNGSFAFLEGTQTFSGTKTFSTAVTINPTSNQLVLGVTRTVTLTAPTPAASSRTHTIPDITGDGTFAFLEGTQTFSGTKTFSAAVTITPTTNQLVLGTTRTVTVSAPTPAASSRTYTMPDITADATFAYLEGTQTFSGAKTFSSAVIINPTTNQLVLGVTNTTTISATAPAASRVYTIPDISGNGSFAFLEGTQTFSGTKTFSATTLTHSTSQTTLAITTVENTGTGIGSGAKMSVFQSGSATTPDAIVALSVNAGATYWFLGIDNSDSDIFKIAHPTTDDTAMGTNTLLNFSTGNDIWTDSFQNYGGTSTIVGWSAFTTQAIYYKTIGKLVWVWFDLDGTSNATNATFTLPLTVAAGVDINTVSMRTVDNGAAPATVGRARLAAGASTVTLDLTNAAGGGWTASGTKRSTGQFFYQAA